VDSGRRSDSRESYAATTAALMNRLPSGTVLREDLQRERGAAQSAAREWVVRGHWVATEIGARGAGAMANLRLTPWFDGTRRPVRPGWYDVKARIYLTGTDFFIRRKRFLYVNGRWWGGVR
jgi:hypothetical protein